MPVNPADPPRFASRKVAAMAVGPGRAGGDYSAGSLQRRTALPRVVAEGGERGLPTAACWPVTGCKLSIGEDMAGPGKPAFPHFGARSFAFSFGHGLGSDVGTLLTQWIGSPCCG